MELPFTGQSIYMTSVCLPPHVHILGLFSVASGSTDTLRRRKRSGASPSSTTKKLVVLGSSTISMTIEQDQVSDVTEWAGN